jgi:hypothetical protein
MPNRSYPKAYWAGTGFWHSFGGQAARSQPNVKREVRIRRESRRPALKVNCHSRRSPFLFPTALNSRKQWTGHGSKESRTRVKVVFLRIGGGVYQRHAQSAINTHYCARDESSPPQRFHSKAERFRRLPCLFIGRLRGSKLAAAAHARNCLQVRSQAARLLADKLRRRAPSRRSSRSRPESGPRWPRFFISHKHGGILHSRSSFAITGVMRAYRGPGCSLSVLN